MKPWPPACPVITTLNAGSVVRDGMDGFIVPIRDCEAMAEKIELLAGDPDLLESLDVSKTPVIVRKISVGRSTGKD